MLANDFPSLRIFSPHTSRTSLMRFALRGLTLLAVVAGLAFAHPLAWSAGTQTAASKQKKSAKASKNSKKPAARPAQKGKVKGFSVNAGVSAHKSKVYHVPTRPSLGMLSGLHATPDPLELRSGVAMVVDADSGAVLFEKNTNTALPIASITKLMTAIVVLDAQQDLNATLMIDSEDTNLEKYSRSRLKPGTLLSRYEALSLALMASENRAANVLTRYYPGGKTAFVQAMNAKAAKLGMAKSQFAEGTGLSSSNMASAADLVKLVQAGLQYPLIRELSTRSDLAVAGANGRTVQFHTTNRLIANPNWDIALQKTGFISEAGQCLVMASRLEGRSIIMVFLDSQGKLSRLGDAQRVRDWLQAQPDFSATALLTTPQDKTAAAKGSMAWSVQRP